MTIGRRWRERGETLVPAALAAMALLLDVADDGESFLHAAAVAVVSLGRYGPSRLGRRFSLWRAFGFLAAAGCFALEVVERLGSPRHVADGTVQLTVLGAAWVVLTGWVWGRRSWDRMVAGLSVPGPEDEVGAHASRRRMRWAGQKMEEA